LHAGIVHRIDKDTSGLLVVAKSDVAHEGSPGSLPIIRSNARISRCATASATRRGQLDARIGRSDANRKKMAVLPKDSSRGKHAVTRYKTLRKMDGCALVECRWKPGGRTRCGFTLRQLAMR
jgi:23S rRNA pseudouridine1911/1915/1917 synthase